MLTGADGASEEGNHDVDASVAPTGSYRISEDDYEGKHDVGTSVELLVNYRISEYDWHSILLQVDR
jgi:hypothetical protein